MRLLLIRHGESEPGLRQLIAEKQCPGLTPRGLQQVQALARRLTSTSEVSECQRLLCSPILRARQTAEALNNSLPTLSIEFDEDLCELHPGEADGLSWEAYHAAYGTFDLLTSPTRVFAPGGESWQQFVARVRATLDRLAARFAGQTVVAVTHAGFIVASVLVLFAIPRPGTAAYLDPDFTSLTEWRTDSAGWQLVRFNDVAHLTTQRNDEASILPLQQAL